MGITPAQDVANIQTLTQKFQALQAPAQSITIVNGPLIVIGQGPFPQLISGLNDIVTTATTIIAQSQGSEQVKEKSYADKLLMADITLVATAQQLFNIMIGKASLFNTVPIIGQPVAAVMRQVEAVMDTVQFGLIDRYETISEDLRLQSQSLSNTTERTINAYSGLQSI